MAHGNHDHPWVQPIIVAKTGSHENIVRIGAQASAALFLNRGAADLPRLRGGDSWDKWLAGPFTKTVRRASYPEIAKVLDWAHENGVPVREVATHDSAAVALPPMRYEELPKVIAKLQVAGTDLPWTPENVASPAEAPVTVFVDEALTTGKATAQAAHALWAAMLAALDADVDLLGWHDLGAPVAVRFTPGERLAVLAGDPEALAIRDAGFTEVAPNTLTAVSFRFGASVPA